MNGYLEGKDLRAGHGGCLGRLLAAAAALAACGCMETQPASRATTATYGDITVEIAEGARSNIVRVTIGDGALASADSTGSTETQTATPTMDVKPDIDVKYNDATGTAAAAVKGVAESLSAGGTAEKAAETP